jgi:hypothetical protein
LFNICIFLWNKVPLRLDKVPSTPFDKPMFPFGT